MNGAGLLAYWTLGWRGLLVLFLLATLLSFIVGGSIALQSAGKCPILPVGFRYIVWPADQPAPVPNFTGKR